MHIQINIALFIIDYKVVFSSYESYKQDVLKKYNTATARCVQGRFELCTLVFRPQYTGGRHKADTKILVTPVTSQKDVTASKTTQIVVRTLSENLIRLKVIKPK